MQQKIKEIERNLIELEENLSKTKKDYNYDDNEYKGISDVKDLLDLSIDEDYYKPITTNSAFNNNYIQYESKGNKDKILTTSEYLDMIKRYLSDIVNDHKTQREWKINLTMAINFISSKPDSDETRIIHTKRDDIKIMMGSEADEIIEELFKSLLQRYQEGLEEPKRGSQFIFDGIDSPEWLKNKKATINPKNNDDKCFQYALTVALNYEQNKKDPQRISRINPFTDQYKCKEINFPSHRKDWKKFESNNKSIALNILYVPHNTEEIRHANKSKYNLKREN